MKLKIVQTNSVVILCYTTQLEQLQRLKVEIVQQARFYRQNYPSKIIKATFLMSVSLRNYNKVLSDLKVLLNGALEWQHPLMVDLIPIVCEGQAERYMSQLVRSNSSEFESNYMKLQAVISNRLDTEIVHNFLKEELQWPQKRLDSNEMTLQEMLEYDGYTYWEKQKITLIKEMINKLIKKQQ